MEAELPDPDERIKRARLSDSYGGPSTSQEVSRNQIVNTSNNTFNHCTLNVSQSMDSEPTVKIDKLDGFPFTPQVFVGRSREIEKLRELVKKHQKVLITGIGGMGKTRLAIECARQWVEAGEFVRAVFINVETEGEAKERFRSLGGRLNVNPEVPNVYQYFKDQYPGLTLFVLDNVEQTNKIEKFLPQKNLKNIKILATSQDCEYQRLFHLFNLNKLTEDKAVDLVKALFNTFQLEYQENGIDRAHLLSVGEQDIAAIQELVKALDGHPLALQHASAFCVDSIIYEVEDDLSQCIFSYLNQLNVKISEDFPDEYEAGYNKTILTSITLNIAKAITKTHVRDFLFTMCFMNPTFIEFKFFRTCGRFSEDEIKECRRILRKHSIVHIRDDNFEDMNIHRLVLLICLSMLRKDNLETHIVEIIFGMYFGESSARIYHGTFLFKNTNFEKTDLAGLYINAFKKSPFMSKLSATLQRIDLTGQDLEGWSVLHYCKFAEHDYWFDYFQDMYSESMNVDWPLEIVKLLKGVNVELDSVVCSKTVVKDLTLLHFYVAYGFDRKYFNDLTDRTEDKEIVTSNKLFNLATRNKNYHFGFELLKRGAKYEDKDKALMCAVLRQDLDLTRTLIEEGADVNFTDDAGLSPIFFAVATANTVMLNELQQHGANIETLNVKDGIKSTALLSVIWGEFVASHDYLHDEFYFFEDDWFHRSEAQVLTAVELLIKNGADVNCFNLYNKTPLMFALLERYVDVAVKLIEGGADVNKANHHGDTPLIIAKSNNFNGSLIKLMEERAGICAEYRQSAPTPTPYDLDEPEKFLNNFWKWRLKFSRDPNSQMIQKKTYQEIQAYLEESQKNIRKLLQSTSDPSSKASIQDLDKKISEIFQIERRNLEEEVDKLDFSSFAKDLFNNLNRSIQDATDRSEYDALGVLKTLAEFIFETRFEPPANSFDLYDKYVNIKFRNGAFSVETEIQLDTVRRDHQKLAVRLLLPGEKSYPGLEELKTPKNSKETLARVGILTLKDGQLKYINSSVAQYFLSEYLISNFKSEVVQTILLHKVLIAGDFNLTRQFFDRSHILSTVELTDKVKDSVRLALQGDEDYLLLERVAEEGLTHTMKFLLIQFKSEMDILSTMLMKAGKHGGTVLHVLHSKIKSETLMVYLNLLKEYLDRENLKRLLVAANQNGEKILLNIFLCSSTENLKDCLNFLKDNLDPEDLKLLWKSKDPFGRIAVDFLKTKPEKYNILLDFAKDNLLTR